ncbi:MAG TPA: ComF family protein [Sphingomonas sp.]
MAPPLSETLLRPARAAWALALDFVLPPRCPGCGLVVDGDHRFCAACWRTLEFLGPPACEACAMPLDHGVGEGLRCEACLIDPPAFDRVLAAVAYGDVARTVALRLKYGGRPAVARTMATQMARLVADAPGDALLAAVPLHRWRLWSRGYNQALLIAAAVAERSGRPCLPDALVRTRATPLMRGLGRAARARAVDGAFAVPPARRALLRGRTVLLVDDVFTTGATAGACAATLRRAGASAVWLVCWARVVREIPESVR